MEQSKLAITRMARRLRRKVVDMEEYLEENQAQLDPMQRKRVKHMNKEGHEGATRKNKTSMERPQRGRQTQ